MADKNGGYIGNSPSDSSVTIARQAYTSSGITTDFTFRSGYTPGYLDAYLNGVRLIETDDYVATDGTTLSLTTAAQNGDTLELIAYKAFNVSNFTLQTEVGGNFDISNNLIVGGNLDVNGTSELDVLNVAETATFTGAIDANGNLDVDGHTELDNLNVSGVTTTGGLLDINAGAQANTLKVEDLADNRVVIAGTGGELEDDANFTFDGTQLALGVGLTVTGVSTFASAVDINSSIDVDGHTELDDLNVSGVATVASAKISDLNSGRVVIAGTDGELEDSANLTFDGSTLSVSGNISVGGTLTYEDVTNVDSIGIVTAQSGVHIDDSIVHIGDTDTKIRFPAADTFTVETAGSERLRTTSAGKVLVGFTTERSNFYNTNTINPKVQIEGTNYSDSALSITSNGASNNRDPYSILLLSRSRGTDFASNTVVADNDVLGAVDFQGNDGTQFVSAAAIEAIVDGAPGADDMPGALTFLTTVDGASTPTEKLRITSDGKVGIGLTNPEFKVTVYDAGYCGVTIKSNRTTATDNIGGLHFKTQSTNVAYIQSLVDGTVKIRNTSSLTERLGISTDGKVNVPDGGKFTAGADDDLQIYHDGTNSYVSDSGTGGLKVTGSDVYIRNVSDQDMIHASSGSFVKLYHNNSEKLETTATGAKVTGALEVTQEYPTIRPTLDLNFAATKTLDRRITFTRDGVGTFTDELGIVKYASNNVPRFDHDVTTGESLGLLIEESRSNSWTYSQPTSDISFGSSATKTFNAATAPNGETEAFRITHNGSAGNSNWRATRAINFNADEMVLSVWAKGNGGNNYFLWSFQNLGGAIVRAGFKLEGDGETSIITNGNGGHTLQIEKYPDGWYRCIIIGNTDSSGSTTQFLYTASNYSESSSISGGSTLLWGFQLEQGSFATSYIPTSGTTVTRGRDIATITGTNFTNFYNQTEGTAFINTLMPNPKGVAGIPAYAFKSSANSNYYYGFSRDNTGSYHYVNTSNVNTFVYESLLDEYKVVLGIKENDLNSYINNANQNVNQSTITLFDADILHLGSTTSNNVLNGHIKQFTYYPKRLPDAQLQSLTQQ